MAKTEFQVIINGESWGSFETRSDAECYAKSVAAKPSEHYEGDSVDIDVVTIYEDEEGVETEIETKEIPLS